jgi:hypothetical protein
MSNKETGFEQAPAADDKKAVAYLNLSIIDKDGNKHKLQTGIPIGGKFEKKLSKAILANLGKEGYTFNLVGVLNSAETKEVAAEF